MHDDMPPYLALGSLYITASLSDTNSISMLEGMAAGLPVLQKYDPLNGDQVTEGVNGFVFADAAELKQKISQYRALSAQDKQRLAESTRQSVAKKGYEALAENLLAVYAEAQAHKDARQEPAYLPLKLRRRLKNTVGKIYKRPR